MPTSANLWFDKLKKVLCAMYVMWDGDCIELLSPVQASTLVLDTYAAKGSPAFNSQADKDKFLLSLASLHDALEDPENDLPPELTSRLKQMIVDLQKQLG